jgi:hypothetical protein
MARWGFWDWMAYCCIGIAALGLAVGAALKEEPAMFERLPAVFTSPKWAYVPIILFALGSFILAVRFVGPLFMRASIPSSRIPDSHISERVFVEETPEYLLSLGKDMTSVQREQVVAIYIGKWMKISSPVRNVSSLDARGMFVMSDIDRSQLQSIQMFFDPKWSNRLTLLRRGQNISAVGQIYSISVLDIILRNCELTNWMEPERKSTN